MVYQEHPPHPALKDHIKCYWTLAVPELGSHNEDQCVLAEGFEFSFILAEPIGLVTDNSKSFMVNGSCICGPMTRPIRMRPTGRVELLGVCFRPGGAYPFFPCPADDLVNASVEVDDLWGSKGSRVVDRVRDGCHTMEERIRILDRHFLHYLDKGRRSDSRVAAALSIIESHKGRVDIDRLAELAGISIRQLERRFRERVGMSPKELCRILRFKNVFNHLAAYATDSWASTALACGYYDQSHMIRDFKHYVGTSPAAYFSRRQAGGGLFTGNLREPPGVRAD